MGNTNSSKRLERADKTGVLVLQKQMPPLTKVPEKALEITGLRSLDLSHNQITKLGPGIGKLSRSLTSLILAHNKLSSLDEAIGALSKLETLDVSSNSLSTLPPTLVGCTKLKKLNIEHNVITSLPPAIGDLRSLLVLTAAHNKLSGLPDDFGRLAELVELDLTANVLGILPDTMGGCKKLRLLKVRQNRDLRALPAPLLVGTPLDRIEVDEQLLGGDGLLKGEGADVYNLRRKQLADKELQAKFKGGDIKFST
mmetsp:Transcript_20809/g.61551  ORF Transcript_20809/g.61551 Transcript_20809/m.61551 type:complete len:254 (-) Transcript_20809:99-860(-)